MRIFAADGWRKAIAGSTGLREEAMTLTLVWSEMCIIVQAGDQVTTQRVVRPKCVTASVRLPNLMLSRAPFCTRSVRRCSSMRFVHYVTVTRFPSLVPPLSSNPTLVPSKGRRPG